MLFNRQKKRFSGGGANYGKFVLLAAAGCLALGAEVVYENDFTVRTSTGEIPHGRWYSHPYVVNSRLANTGNDEAYVNSGNGGGSQDGWVHGRGPNCDAYARVIDPTGRNQMVALYSASQGKKAYARHFIGNAFTNGWLELSVDMAAAEVPSSTSDYQARINLGDADLAATGDAYTNSYYNNFVLEMGIYQEKTVGAAQKFRLRHASNKNGELISGVVKGNWYRFVATVDLNNKKWRARIYDMGDTQPDLDLQPVNTTPLVNKSNLGYYKGDAGPLSVLCLAALRTMGGTSANTTKSLTDLANSTRFDNAVIRWGETESAMEACYVNDFTTRKFRRMAARSRTYRYHFTHDRCVESTDRRGYRGLANDAELVAQPANTGNMTAAQKSAYVMPVSWDGWRRLNYDGRSKFKYYKLPANTNGRGADNYVFRFHGPSNTFGVVAVPIGSCLTAGVVRATADMMAPTQWNFDYDTWRISLVLGNDAYYSGTHDTYVEGMGIRAGIGTDDGPKSTTHYPTYRDNRTALFDKSKTLKPQVWYRAQIEADLSARTYTYTLWEIGPLASTVCTNGVAMAEEIGSWSGLAIRDGVTSFSHVGLEAYGSNDQGGQVVYFDNINVFLKENAAAEERLVYQNMVSLKTVMALTPSKTWLGGTINDIDDGQDDFVRRYTKEGLALLSGDADDAYLEIADNNEDSCVSLVHPIGQNIRHGQVTVQVDMRPAPSWGDWGGGAMTFMLGGDELYQGSLGPLTDGGHSFSYYGVTRFGVKSTDSSKLDDRYFCWRHADGNDRACSNAVVTAGHWYRFVAQIDLTAEKQSVSVYDMGTAKPQLSTATPAQPLDVLCADQALRAPMSEVESVSTIAFIASNVRYCPFTDLSSALFDNVRVSHRRLGLAISIR